VSTLEGSLHVAHRAKGLNITLCCRKSKKNGRCIRLPLTLSLPTSTSDATSDAASISDATSNVYVLFAVQNHSGKSADSGHYVAEVMDWTTGVWFECNDESVKMLDNGPSGVYGNNGCSRAYNLFYVKQDYLARQVKKTVLGDDAKIDSWRDTPKKYDRKCKCQLCFVERPKSKSDTKKKPTEKNSPDHRVPGTRERGFQVRGAPSFMGFQVRGAPTFIAMYLHSLSLAPTQCMTSFLSRIPFFQDWILPAGRHRQGVQPPLRKAPPRTPRPTTMPRRRHPERLHPRLATPTKAPPRTPRPTRMPRRRHPKWLLPRQ